MGCASLHVTSVDMDVTLVDNTKHVTLVDNTKLRHKNGCLHILLPYIWVVYGYSY